MTEPDTQAKRREKTFAIVFAFKNHEIGIRQCRAQLKDLGYEEWEINLYIDGDIMHVDEE